jgi:hypothetical protein
LVSFVVGARWMRNRAIAGYLAAVSAVAMLSAAAAQQAPYDPPRHLYEPPAIGASPEQFAAYASQGVELEHDRDAAWALAEYRRVDRALGALQPQRKGVIDAYVVAVALDSDPVFGREAREAGRVLSRRYGAAGRTIVLAGRTAAPRAICRADRPRISPSRSPASPN